MNQLYFVRHGESEANAAKVWSPYDSPLTDLGRWQATAAGTDASCKGLRFDRIISSPQPRAVETARLIADELDYKQPIETWQLLTERNWGDLAGQPEHHYYEKGGSLQGLNALPTVEHIEAVQKRASDVLSMVHQLQAQSVLLVGHGDFARALLREINEQHWTDEYARPLEEQAFPHAQITQIFPR